MAIMILLLLLQHCSYNNGKLFQLFKVQWLSWVHQLVMVMVPSVDSGAGDAGVGEVARVLLVPVC